VARTLGIALVFYWLKSLATTYEITSQRVRIERGILSKIKDSIELFRIDHFDLHKPLGMRLAGYCLLHLRSSDASFETVILYGLPNLELLADTLRECSRANAPVGGSLPCTSVRSPCRNPSQNRAASCPPWSRRSRRFRSRYGKLARHADGCSTTTSGSDLARIRREFVDGR
jgi:hypothetical protein